MVASRVCQGSHSRWDGKDKQGHQKKQLHLEPDIPAFVLDNIIWNRLVKFEVGKFQEMCNN